MNNKKTLISTFLVAVLFGIGFSESNINFQKKSNTSPELGYFSYSPNGKSGGASIPASCESGYSHAGECYVPGAPPTTGGMPPSIPTGPGPIPPTPQCPCESASNSCGMRNSGFGACGTLCPIPSPSDTFCPAVALEVTQTSTGSGGSSTGGGVIAGGKAEQTVSRGGRCSISWNASPATSCQIIGEGVNQSVPVSGSYLTPPINKSSVFQITCSNGSVVSTTKNFTCKLNPTYLEVGGSQ